MKTVTMLEFRRNAAKILDLARRGQSILLTYRGEPAVVMEPASSLSLPTREDPFYRLGEIAEEGGETLTNDEIDRILYGP